MASFSASGASSIVVGAAFVGTIDRNELPARIVISDRLAYNLDISIPHSFPNLSFANEY